VAQYAISRGFEPELVWEKISEVEELRSLEKIKALKCD
jgi:hypothetical protein